MKSSRAVAAFVAITLAAFGATASAKEPRIENDSLVFSLPDLEGTIVRSSDRRFEEKVLLVTLWGTWCPPCVSEIPTLNDLQNRYGGDGLVIVGIAFERESPAASRQDHLRKFAREHEIRYLVLDGGTTNDFSTALPMVEDVRGLPVEILIGRSGKVVDSRNGNGYKKRWARRLENRLKALLGKTD